MRYRSGSPWYSGGGILGFPPAISQIVLVNLIVFLMEPVVFGSMAPHGLALVPREALAKGMVWELFTYMFLHGGFMHLFFNMFGLLMFGPDLERWWGSRNFTKYYLITGVGAGVVQVLTAYLFPGGGPYPAYLIPTIGASGAIFGVLVAFGMAFPERTVLLFLIVPVSARTMVIIFGLLELTMALQYQGGGGVARFAHLGGMLVGYLYLRQETLLWKGKRWWRQVRGGRFRRTARRNEETDPALRAEIDRILDKISREGMGSLTRREREMLAESAERARRRQRGEPE